MPTQFVAYSKLKSHLMARLIRQDTVMHQNVEAHGKTVECCKDESCVLRKVIGDLAIF